MTRSRTSSANAPSSPRFDRSKAERGRRRWCATWRRVGRDRRPHRAPRRVLSSDCRGPAAPSPAERQAARECHERETGHTASSRPGSSARSCDAIPADVRREGVRTFVNWLGCAVGGASHETVDRALARRDAVLRPARRRRCSAAASASTCCTPRCSTASRRHVLDYDDTHLKTIIHPAGPVASALLAVAETAPGHAARDFLDGADPRRRGRMPHRQFASIPSITTAAGTSPARPACSARRPRSGKLHRARRDADGLGAWHRRDAVLRPARDVRHDVQELPSRPRRAERRDGRVPRRGRIRQSPLRGIEAPRGFANVLSTKQDYGEILDGLGDALGGRAQQLQALRLRHRHPSDDRRLPAAPRRARRRGRTGSSPSSCAPIRWCWN